MSSNDLSSVRGKKMDREQTASEEGLGNEDLVGIGNEHWGLYPSRVEGLLKHVLLHL